MKVLPSPAVSSHLFLSHLIILLVAYPDDLLLKKVNMVGHDILGISCIDVRKLDVCESR